MVLREECHIISIVGLIPGLGGVGSARGRGQKGQGRSVAMVESGGAAPARAPRLPGRATKGQCAIVTGLSHRSQLSWRLIIKLMGTSLSSC